MLPLIFFLTTTTLFLQNVLIPKICLFAYGPWIASIILRCHLPKALWLAFLSGAVVDCLSEDPSGVHALNYTIITMLLFRFKTWAFMSNPVHLSLFTVVISFLSTLLQLFLLFLFDRRIPFTGQWAFGDLSLMPIADGIYALTWISLPLFIYKKITQFTSVYWNNIKQKLFPT